MCCEQALSVEDCNQSVGVSQSALLRGRINLHVEEHVWASRRYVAPRNDI